jgi:hypothetical protein
VAVFESQEMKGILAGAINRLGEREKIVITLYYLRGPHHGRDRAGPAADGWIQGRDCYPQFRG